MSSMRTRFVRITALTVLTSALACNGGGNAAIHTSSVQSQETPVHAAKTMKIRIKIGNKIATATLEDNESARDFASLLPLILAMRDYNSTEKIADLPRKLSTSGAPDGIDPSVGDLTYYAPWGNLAIFYKDFDYSKGLIRLGTIDSGLDVIEAAGSGEITIELVK